MKLYPYQQEDVTELMKHNTHGVFNEQRTGKTPTSLVSITSKVSGKIIIIATASMIYKWKSEAQAWTDRPVFAYLGSITQREVIFGKFKNSTNGILVISYDLFKETKRNKGMLKDILKAKPEGLIIDEVHRCVGRKTANFKSSRSLVKIPHRLYLTGTPAPNHPSQVWAILTMIHPKKFSSYWQFVDDYFNIEEQKLPSYIPGRGFIEVPKGFKTGMEEKFADMLAEHSIMRKRIDVMPWLKDMTTTKIKLPLTKQQTKYLSELSQYYETEHIIVQGILDQLLRYRQICNAPELLQLQGSSPKIDWLDEYIKDYPDKSIIIFSRFTQFIKLIKEKVGGAVGVISGSVKLNTRQDLIDSFQRGKIKVLAIQIDAGKEGLTLDNADTLIFTDLYPPASDILQAKDRIIATNAESNTPKEIIELMMEDSYDEELFNLVYERIELTDVANNYIDYIKKGEGQ